MADLLGPEAGGVDEAGGLLGVAEFGEVVRPGSSTAEGCVAEDTLAAMCVCLPPFSESNFI